MKYCFVSLLDAHTSASGLAFRMIRLWQELEKASPCVYLIANKSLITKVLGPQVGSRNIFVINDRILGFKLSCLLYFPIYLSLMLLKGVNSFHLSAGAAHFAAPLNFLGRYCPFLKLRLHTSLGSRSIQMASHGVKEYINLHKELINSVNKVDCLYPTDDFEGGRHKFTLAPGSFSWRFDSTTAREINNEISKNKNIVFCGSLVPQKNGDLAIKLFAEYCEKYDTSEMNLLIHAPEVPGDISYLLASLPLAIRQKIIFRKSHQYVSDLLESGYFMSLQAIENYPSQSLLEAMIAGCSVIATDVGDTKLLVDPHNCNVLIDLASDDVAEKVHSLMKEKLVFNRKNHELVLANHDLSVYALYFKRNFFDS